MAKLTGGKRRQYLENIEPYRLSASQFLSQERAVLATLKNDVPSKAAFKRIGLVRDMVNLASNYIVINALSQSMLKINNEDALNEGRKSLYKGIIYLEEILGNLVDAPFADYEERLADIANLSVEYRYRLIRKMGLGIQLLEDAYGGQSKWRWAFVELEGRFAAAAKNILDLKVAFSNTDPRSPEYEPTVRHLQLVKKLLLRAADRYRERYELSTSHIDDFNQGIQFLAALKRLHALMGEREKAEVIQKKLDSWAAKLEGDLRNRGDSSGKKN